MSVTRWSTTSSLVTLLDSALNTLANDARAVSGAQVATRDLYADFELKVTFAGTPPAGAYVALYLIPTLDGTNYADGDADVQPAPTLWVGNFPVRGVTTQQRVPLRRVLLPPVNWKALVHHRATQAMAASGNVLAYRSYGESLE